MTKANLKNILTAVRDIINRSRIAYKDYLGEETVTETKVLVEGTLSERGTLIRKDPSFTRFVVGEGYEVTIDGTTQTLTAISDSGVGVITNATDLNNPGENYFAVGVNLKNSQPLCKAGGTYIGKTISISQTKTTTTKKYDIKKVPQELIPDTIARSADVAKVKTKADDAFNKADAAQAAANRAATKVDPVFTGSFSQNRKENTVIGSYSHAEGYHTTASGGYSHAEGNNTTASDYYSHAEGYHTTASKGSSHAEGYFTTASERFSHAEGYHTTASGESSHAEGYYVTASRGCSHAEGYYTTASGSESHAEGDNTTASGDYSHAEGYHTTASGESSHAEGNNTIAKSSYSHVQGKYNIEDLANTYAHIVGNGSNDNARSNAHTIDWSGNAWFAGTVEGTALIIPSSTEGSTKKFKITVDDSGALTATEIV